MATTLEQEEIRQLKVIKKVLCFKHLPLTVHFRIHLIYGGKISDPFLNPSNQQFEVKFCYILEVGSRVFHYGPYCQ